ncbi:MAG: VanZ family protein [Haloferacaceae archaeon]
MRVRHTAASDAVLVLVVGGLLLASAVPTRGTTGGSLLGVGVDKWLHAAGFATVVISLAASRYARGWSSARVALAALALGAAVEVLQFPIPWRDASGLDLLADAVGVVLGLGAWAAWEAWTARGRADRDGAE